MLEGAEKFLSMNQTPHTSRCQYDNRIEHASLCLFLKYLKFCFRHYQSFSSSRNNIWNTLRYKRVYEGYEICCVYTMSRAIVQ